MIQPICSIPGCGLRVKARGFCSMHYDRFRRGYVVDGPRQRAYRRAACSVDECEGLSSAKGMCPMHYQRWKRYGDPLIHKERLPPGGRSWTRSEKTRFYKFGLTPDAYEAMFESQGRRCYCCRATKSDGKGWCVDHCHETGAVRAILCNRCNRVLGLCNEDPEILRRLADLAAEYTQLRLA